MKHTEVSNEEKKDRDWEGEIRTLLFFMKNFARKTNAFYSPSI